jgi:hypothetical protein
MILDKESNKNKFVAKTAMKMLLELVVIAASLAGLFYFLIQPRYRTKVPYVDWKIPPLQPGESDRTRWHLENFGEPGRQVWVYVDPSDKKFEQNFIDKFYVDNYTSKEFPLPKVNRCLSVSFISMSQIIRINDNMTHDCRFIRLMHRSLQINKKKEMQHINIYVHFYVHIVLVI